MFNKKKNDSEKSTYSEHMKNCCPELFDLDSNLTREELTTKLERCHLSYGKPQPKLSEDNVFKDSVKVLTDFNEAEKVVNATMTPNVIPHRDYKKINDSIMKKVEEYNKNVDRINQARESRSSEI